VNVTDRLAPRGAIIPQHDQETLAMLMWTLIFLVIALVAGALGFSGVSFAAAGIARVLFLIFVIGFVVALILGFVRGW
jgi:uncharacterized membrane protein YtjA (UPF0391 family)